MLPDQLIEEWDLGNTESFGLFDFKQYVTTEAWAAEKEKRKSFYENLPIYIEKFTDNLKIKMRTGIPSERRRCIWLQATGGFKLLLKGNLWDLILDRAMKRPLTDCDLFGSQIDLFNFLQPDTCESLRIFLHVVWIQNQTILYEPMIPLVSAMLLMYLEPPLAYAAIQAMINRSIEDSWYFTLRRDRFLAFAETVSKNAERTVPDVCKKAKELNVMISQIAIAIFPTFFLPFTTIPVALTFFDSFVLEGRKILLRLTIGLLVQKRTPLLLCKSAKEFVETIMLAAQNLQTPEIANALIKESFALSLSRGRHIDRPEREAMKNPAQVVQSRQPIFMTDILKQNRKSLAKEFNRSTLPVSYIKPFPSIAKSMSEGAIVRTAPDVQHGGLIDDSTFLRLRHFFPVLARSYSAECVFRLSEHGCMIAALCSKCSKVEPHILVIKTESNLFGAFIPTALTVEGKKFYGGPSSFVFTADELKVFVSVIPTNGMFISISDDEIMIGGPKPAIFLDWEMATVNSEECETFNSPRLTASHKVLDIEAYRLYLRPITQRP